MRAYASCYMNLRYSRPLELCKKQFVTVFCSEEFIEQIPLDDDSRVEYRDERDRNKFEKQHQFYVQLANDEISRVVASLLRFDTEGSYEGSEDQSK